jgi:hypothetical protein
LLVVTLAHAQTNGCQVWSRAENRCLQAAAAPQNISTLSPDIAGLQQEIARLRRENESLRSTCAAPSAQLAAENGRAQQEQDQRLEAGSFFVKIHSAG